jgi:uncharacterized protein YebE (UPF0316 family)
MINLFIGFELSDITLNAILGGLLIAAARVFDVSLSVLRQASIRAGLRRSAWIIGFVEALVWVFVVAKVVTNLTNPVYAVFYALGFATGTFVGVTLEGMLARGEQVVRIFTHNPDMAASLRRMGYRVTVFEGEGLKGPVKLLFIHVIRKKAPLVPSLARKLDPECFIVVDDVRSSSVGSHTNYALNAMQIRK